MTAKMLCHYCKFLKNKRKNKKKCLLQNERGLIQWRRYTCKYLAEMVPDYLMSLQRKMGICKDNGYHYTSRNKKPMDAINIE